MTHTATRGRHGKAEGRGHRPSTMRATLRRRDRRGPLWAFVVEPPVRDTLPEGEVVGVPPAGGAYPTNDPGGDGLDPKTTTGGPDGRVRGGMPPATPPLAGMPSGVIPKDPGAPPFGDGIGAAPPPPLGRDPLRTPRLGPRALEWRVRTRCELARWSPSALVAVGESCDASCGGSCGTSPARAGEDGGRACGRERESGRAFAAGARADTGLHDGPTGVGAGVWAEDIAPKEGDVTPPLAGSGGWDDGAPTGAVAYGINLELPDALPPRGGIPLGKAPEVAATVGLLPLGLMLLMPAKPLVVFGGVTRPLLPPPPLLLLLLPLPLPAALVGMTSRDDMRRSKFRTGDRAGRAAGAGASRRMSAESRWSAAADDDAPAAAADDDATAADDDDDDPLAPSCTPRRGLTEGPFCILPSDHLLLDINVDETRRSGGPP
eukprot:TRINITY_DN6297_c0_g1_i1.p2 TRINITY_DN6297_c0_g1~~TRINITY_DN6297_c0_g1_i1.p2  ORF type:complete len:433 (-),score=65.54 TRINITY_DN6297_c0_g1_i1:131-1429(-)